MSNYKSTWLAVFLSISVSTMAQPTTMWYNIKDFGASGVKSALSTKAFELAIEKINKAGGGTLYIPPGEYTSGTITLCDNLVLYLEAGATLYASNDTAVYKSRGHTEGQIPMLLYASGRKNIRITGSGTIQGEPRYSTRSVVPYDFIEKEYAIAKSAGLDLIMPNRFDPSVTLLYFTDCNNVKLDGVSIVNSPLWAVHLHWCNNVIVQGIIIKSDLKNGVNSDGLDIDGCSNVMISDCYISTGDDAIVLKTTLFNGKYRACEDVTVTNCVLESSSTALKLGTESHGDFTRILFSNCVIKNTNRGLGIFIRDGGKASKVVFENIIMQGVRKDFHWWGDGDLVRFLIMKRKPESRLGAIEDVTIRNVVADVQGTSLISSRESNAIKRLVLENISLTMYAEQTADKRADNVLTIENVQDLSLRKIAVTWDTVLQEKKWQHAIQVKNASHVLLKDIQIKNAPLTKQIPIDLIEVREGFIAEIRYNPNIEKVLRLGGVRSQHIEVLDLHKRRIVLEAFPSKQLQLENR